MTDADRAASATPRGRGPKTPEGKARSAMNARRHGLRARTFGILPGEEQAEWAEHLADLQAGYGPVDDTELKLVEAIAAAMWNEIRADRTLAEVLAAIPPLGPRPAPRRRPAGAPARALLEHRPALLDRRLDGQPARPARLPRPPQGQARTGLLVPEPAAPPDAANENRTNENMAAAAKCTNELPPGAPPPAVAALRARLDRLLDGSGPTGAEEWDLVEAIRAARLPGAAPYRGAIDRSQFAGCSPSTASTAPVSPWLAATGPPGHRATGPPGHRATGPPGPQPERAAPMARGERPVSGAITRPIDGEQLLGPPHPFQREAAQRDQPGPCLARGVRERGGDDHLLLQRAAQRLDPGDLVDGRAHDGEVEPVPTADVAVEHVANMQRHMHAASSAGGRPPARR